MMRGLRPSTLPPRPSAPERPPRPRPQGGAAEQAVPARGGAEAAATSALEARRSAEETAKAQAERAARAGKERATAEWRTAEALADLQVAAEEHDERLREAVEARV